MPLTTSYRRGDVVLVPFPFTDLTGSKQRPALVVSSDAFNASHDDVLLVAITSRVPATLSSNEVVISSTDLGPSGLLKPSVVKTAKLITIHQALIRKSIGKMPPPALKQVLEVIREQFEP
jgi:mRNA interferase MazF